MAKYYCDYLTISGDFDPCMDVRRINSSPDKWLAFYPHESFVRLLKAVLDQFGGGNQSVWLAGAYGTGKSHAALVLQKLLMDDAERVERWLERHRQRVPETVANRLRAVRSERALAVFTSGSDSIDSANKLLVRMEQAVFETLKSLPDSIIPIFGNLKKVMDRVQDEGERFFVTRDTMLGEMSQLTQDIRSFADLTQRLEQAKSEQDSRLLGGLYSDVMQVLHRRDIYVDLSSDNFLRWVKDVAENNKFRKVLFIWDEFSEYVNNNQNRLATFQDLAQASQDGVFYLLPITHLKLEAFLGSGTDNAKKVGNRFVTCELEMPTHTAIELAGTALEARDKALWEQDRLPLWQSVEPLVRSYMSKKDSDCRQNPESFCGILPLHPMAAVILKHLSVMVGANQRSLFSFLRSQDGNSEFGRFLQEGSPDLRGKQFLTVDYLWSYFVEREDLGRDEQVGQASIEYQNKSRNLSDQERRVFKAALIYCLLERLQGQDGSELTMATQENISRCFDGDGGVVGVPDLLRNLQSKYCLMLYADGHCGMFQSAIGGPELEKKKGELRAQFHQRLLEPLVQSRLRNQVDTYCKDKVRLEVRVASLDKAAAISQGRKEWFGAEGNRVLLQFVVAQNEEVHLQLQDRITKIAGSLPGFRMLYITFPDLHFCTHERKNWENFVDLCAHSELAKGDAASCENFQNQCKQLVDKWFADAKRTGQRLTVHYLNLADGDGALRTEDCTWEQLGNLVNVYIRQAFSCYTDDLSGYNVNALRPNGGGQASWASHGFSLRGGGMFGGTTEAMLKLGIKQSDTWFKANSTHPLALLRNRCDELLNKALNNKSDSRFLFSGLYRMLSRPPFGLLPIPFSSYLLGFAVFHWVQDERHHLQVTDGRQSVPLDEETLAQLIGDAVRNEGQSPRGERWLCRLSPEELEFIRQAPMMFQLPQEPDSTLKAMLDRISGKLLHEAGKIPLQVLSGGGDTAVDTVIGNVSTALSISSKGNQQELSELIRECGRLLKQDETLAKRVRDEVSPENLRRAFERRLTSSCPELGDLLARIGLKLSQCGDELREGFADTASWLWGIKDVERELGLLVRRYRVVEQLQGLFGNRQYVRCRDGLDKLRRAMRERNRLSLASLSQGYPSLKRLDGCLACPDESRLEELCHLLSEQREALRELFFDIRHSRQLALLRQWFPEQLGKMSEEELSRCYEAFKPFFVDLDDEEFRRQALSVIEEQQKSSAARRLGELWQQKTNTASPQDWVNLNRMPVEVLFEQPELAREILPVLENAQIFQATEIERCRVTLDSAKLKPARRWHEHFMVRYMPENIRELPVEPQQILDYLCANLNQNPQMWELDNARLQSVVTRFFRETYATTVKQQAIDKARQLSEKEAKRQLLRLLENTPEAGLDFLNGN